MPKFGDKREDGRVFAGKNKSFASGERWVPMDVFLKENPDWFARRARMDANVKARAEEKIQIAIRKAAFEAERPNRIAAKKERNSVKAAAYHKRRLLEDEAGVRAKSKAWRDEKNKDPEWRESERLRIQESNAKKRGITVEQLVENARKREALAEERRAKKAKASEDAESRRIEIQKAKELKARARAEREASKPARRLAAKQRAKDLRKKWKKANKSSLALSRRNYKHRRRAIIRNQEAKATPKQIREAMTKAKSKCHYCRKKSMLTIDHVIPIAGGGTHTLDNIVFACHDCNSSKRDLPANEFGGCFGLLLV